MCLFDQNCYVKDHSVIQSAVDQAKMKFHILGKEAVKKKENKVKKVIYHEGVAVETLHESNEKNPEEEFNLKYNQVILPYPLLPLTWNVCQYS